MQGKRAQISDMSVQGAGAAIDRYLDTFDVRSSHESEVRAPAQVTYRAARDLDLGHSPLTTVLFAIRGIPHLVTGKAVPTRSITFDTLLRLGFTILEELPGREIVLGAVGKFWLPTSGLLPLNRDDFLGFTEPGYAKAAMAFRVEEIPRGSLLVTETRVLCTDASARRRFSLYWRLVGPFSGLIRHEMLSQIKQTAETRQEPS